MKDKLLIFDMDNTILQSCIDFSAMRQVVGEMLAARGQSHYLRRSAADTLLNYQNSSDYDPMYAKLIWNEVARIEDEGLAQAVPEPGALSALEFLSHQAELAVLTNNTDFNLVDNLGRLGILPYLSCVAGRDKVGRLKPAPDGMLYIMRQYPQIDVAHTVGIGDAWNDAVAARDAGCAFAAYNCSRQEEWTKLDVYPQLFLTEWNEQACHKLLALAGQNYDNVAY